MTTLDELKPAFQRRLRPLASPPAASGVTAPFAPWSGVGFAFVLSECVGILRVPAGTGRVSTGPFGKSDRAFALGAVTVLVAIGLSGLLWWLLPALALLSAIATVNRVRAETTKSRIHGRVS